MIHMRQYNLMKFLLIYRFQIYPTNCTNIEMENVCIFINVSIVFIDIFNVTTLALSFKAFHSDSICGYALACFPVQ